MTSINQMIGLTFAFVAIYFISESEGLKCYVGTVKNHQKVDCPGSCFADLYVVPPPFLHTIRKMGCSKGQSRDECESMGALTTCFCNTDFCNLNNLASVRLRFRQNDISIKRNREDRRSNGLNCYVGWKVHHEEVNCSGSCFYGMTVVPKLGMKIGCAPYEFKDGCQTSTFGMVFCFCNKDLCNLVERAAAWMQSGRHVIPKANDSENENDKNKIISHTTYLTFPLRRDPAAKKRFLKKSIGKSVSQKEIEL